MPGPQGLYDPMNEHELEFAQLIRKASDTQPQTIQDFFILLNELQKKQDDSYARNTP